MGRLGDLPSSAIIEGRVVYRRKQAGTDRYTVGVEFLDFVNTSREELVERIQTWQGDDASTSLFITVGEGRLYEKAVEIECRDISGGGLSFETRRAIPLEARSKIIMGRLGDLPSSAIIEGRVVYRRKQAGTDRYTVGVEFLDFVNTSREELVERIQTWQGDDASTSTRS